MPMSNSLQPGCCCGGGGGATQTGGVCGSCVLQESSPVSFSVVLTISGTTATYTGSLVYGAQAGFNGWYAANVNGGGPGITDVQVDINFACVTGGGFLSLYFHAPLYGGSTIIGAGAGAIPGCPTVGYGVGCSPFIATFNFTGCGTTSLGSVVSLVLTQ